MRLTCTIPAPAANIMIIRYNSHFNKIGRRMQRLRKSEEAGKTELPHRLTPVLFCLKPVLNPVPNQRTSVQHKLITRPGKNMVAVNFLSP